MREANRLRENREGLPGISLPEKMWVTHDLDEAIFHASDDTALLLVAVPVSGLRDTVSKLGKDDFPCPNLICLCKGFEENTGLLPHQVVAALVPDELPVGILSGPSFAQEVANRLPCALTLASASQSLRQSVSAALNVEHLRIYSSDDVMGVAVGGGIKNILAIAAGISDGLGFGLNARAALMTRGLAEATRLGTALGGRPETFMGLTGMGDLILTCTGDLSRNRQVGLLLAQGVPLDAVIHGLGHVAEGVHCAKAVCALAEKQGVEMPITRAVVDVLFNGESPRDMVSRLMSRRAREESDAIYRAAPAP
jgi:glycerol-3-phosphate dehydrogenase (NAD(P)+)